MSSPVCFKQGTESTFKDESCCKLSVAGSGLVNDNTAKEFVAYCPENTSVCARVAKTNPTDRYFRNCKDYFSGTLKLNKYNDALSQYRSKPAVNKLVADISALKSINATNAKLVSDLETTMRLVNKDIAAI